MIYYALAILVPFNGITNALFGELISEALIVLFGLLYFLGSRNLKTKNIALALIFLYVIFEQAVYLFLTGQPVRIIFSFPLVLLLIMLLSEKESYKKNITRITKIFIFCACISALFAVLQRLNLFTLIPLETEHRARGLCRSSLNLTGVLIAALVMAVLNDRTKPGLKHIFIISILFSGLIAAGGRGGMIAGLMLIITKEFIFSRYGIERKAILLTMFIFIALLAGDYFLRAFSAFNFVFDQSNLDRLTFYLLFTEYFNIWGVGFGATSPAAIRFVGAENIIGFESTFLNMIHEIGIIQFSIIIFVYFIYLMNSDKTIRARLILLIISLSPIIFGQQLYQIPSAFVGLLIAIDIINRKGTSYYIAKQN